MMPKGVEHMSAAWPVTCWDRVKKSMMPKGVEHTVQSALLDKEDLCEEIYDAERR